MPFGVLELHLTEQSEPGFPAHRVGRGMADARKGMQIPVPPIGPRHIDNGTGRPGSEPAPLELGQDPHPVSHTNSPRHSRSQNPIDPTVSPLPADSTRYMHPRPSPRYRRCRASSCAPLSGPPK